MKFKNRLALFALAATLPVTELPGGTWDSPARPSNAACSGRHPRLDEILPERTMRHTV